MKKVKNLKKMSENKSNLEGNYFQLIHLMTTLMSQLNQNVYDN